MRGTHIVYFGMLACEFTYQANNVNRAKGRCSVYQYMNDCSACHWEKLAIDGVESKTLYFDELTNARTVETRLHPGATIPRHSHTHATETVYVLSGDFVEKGIEYGAGAYFVGKAGTAHGPHHSKNGCIVLTHWTGGPVDFVEEILEDISVPKS